MSRAKLLGTILFASSIAACTTAPVKEQPKYHITKPSLTSLLQAQSQEIMNSYPITKYDNHLIIDGDEQKLYLMRGDELIKSYDVSTARNGFGSEEDSLKTPLGVHKIHDKIGDGAKFGTEFKYRMNMGRVATIYTDPIDVSVDPVTSRIIWLDGLEERNQNSLERYIYIHGTHEEGLIGNPASDGCIRMKNRDVIDLFDRVEEGTYVTILEDLR